MGEVWRGPFMSRGGGPADCMPGRTPGGKNPGCMKFPGGGPGGGGGCKNYKNNNGKYVRMLIGQKIILGSIFVLNKIY